MAENQNNQQGSAELLKSCFELQEVADRWSNLKGRVITVDEILDYEAQGILRIAARTGFYDKIRRETRSFVFTKDGKTVTTTKEEVGEFDSAQALYYPPKGKASLLARDDAVVRVTGLKKDDFFGLTSYELENDPPFSPFDVTLKREALRVSIEEVQRFEREEMNTAPDAAPSWVDMTPQQKRAHASARYAELGNFEAVGREMGITGKRVSQLVEGHAEGASKKREGASLGAELLNMTPPAKQGKSRS